MMKNESRTLYIPLCGKAFVSKKGIILEDKKAEEIWEKEQFPIGRKSNSKWLAYFMGMRAAVIDKWVSGALLEKPESVVIHIGCGLDSRIERVKAPFEKWYDVDLPDVIEVRKKHFSESEKYKMLGASAMETEWFSEIGDFEHAIIVMEGISMYLSKDAVNGIFAAAKEKFPSGKIIMDVYTELAVKMSKYKNPIKEVGALPTFGTSEHGIFETEKIRFCKELCMTPAEKIDELSGFEKAFFKKMFAGNFAKKLYKIFTYEF